MNSRRFLVALACSAAAGAIALSACFVGSRNLGSSLTADDRSPPDLQPREKLLVDIFKDSSRSVVFITNSALVRRQVGFFYYRDEEVQQGSGSGFVWDKNGHIVTNAHVVDGASKVSVTLADDPTPYPAEKIGVYRDKDVAVWKINAPANKLHPVRVGQSSVLQVGQTALAIGNPFGLDHTLTVGVVSALGREIRAINGRRITDVIQTDAAINPGNSGGPLLNSKGELIGMNTAIMSPSGASAGIGFAVPSDVVQRIVRQIIAGRIRRPGLGVRVWPPSIVRQVLRYYRLPAGVLLNEAPSESAAGKAGLRPTVIYSDGQVKLGDLIVGIGGHRVEDHTDLQDITDRYNIGDVVEVHYVREGEERKIRVKLQEIAVEPQ